jgi:hypothetical protein
MSTHTGTPCTCPDCASAWISESLAGENGLVVLNPSAIGNPGEVPQVWIGADLRAMLQPCGCGGINGFHAEDCDGG